MKNHHGLRLGCWNVNSLRVRLGAVQEWLTQQDIDVALLQETKVQDHEFPWQALNQLGYECAFWGQKAYNGVAILSRLPLTQVTRIDIHPSGHARCLSARAGPWHVMSVYVPQGQTVHAPAFQEKKAFLQALTQHVHAHACPTEPWIIGGDWNIAPTDQDAVYADTWANQVMCTQIERVLLRRLMSSGWGDVGDMAGHHGPTWWPYRHQARERNDGLRIDYGLLNPAARDRWIGYDICPQWRDQERPSDHIPWHVDMSSAHATTTMPPSPHPQGH
jgi:exodeoxyribonuclease-3